MWADEKTPRPGGWTGTGKPRVKKQFPDGEEHTRSSLRLGNCGPLRCRPLCVEPATRWGSMAQENRAGLGGAHGPVHCRHKGELRKGLKQRRGLITAVVSGEVTDRDKRREEE